MIFLMALRRPYRSELAILWLFLVRRAKRQSRMLKTVGQLKQLNCRNKGEMNDPMEAPPVERKLIAILAADVEGYSRMMHENESQTLATLSAHRATMDSLIESFNGQVSGTAGDSVLAEFASAVDAVHCAVAIQQSLSQANSRIESVQRMMFRIGINVGDVIVKDGDLFGDGVNVAARLQALATPGGICVTRGVRDQVRDKLEYGFDDMGEQRVKNIPRPIRFFSVKFDPHGTTATSQSGDDSSESDTSAKQPLDPVEVDIEIAFWDTVKDSEDTAMFEAYIEKYPDGEFRKLAEIKLAQLRN
jgi:adenylate cyclase